MGLSDRLFECQSKRLRSPFGSFILYKRPEAQDTHSAILQTVNSMDSFHLSVVNLSYQASNIFTRKLQSIKHGA
jgi:hypothetical protein